MPEEKPRVEQEKTLLVWKAPSRPFKAKDKQVLTVPVVIAILVGIIMMIAGEWVIIALIAAILFAYYMWSTVPPEETEFALTNRGVKMHGRVYEWETLSRWWMEDRDGQKLIMIETPMEIAGRLVMPTGKVDIKEAEKLMDRYVLREKPMETRFDKAGKWLADKFPLTEKT